MTSEMLKKRKIKLLLGAAAAALFMIADVLWQARGADAVNTTLGVFADKAWLNMSTWRFVASNILYAVSVPLYYIGFTEMYHIIRERARDKVDMRLAKLFRVGMLAGTMAFMFIHTLCLNMPLIMKAIAPHMPVEDAAKITNDVMMLNIVPMIGYYLAADGVLTIAMFALVWRRTLPLNRFALLCNPICASVIGNVLAMLPWPMSQISYAGEACGHLLIMVAGWIIVMKDEKKMPKRRTKKPADDEDRPILNLDDEPDADVTII